MNLVDNTLNETTTTILTTHITTEERKIEYSTVLKSDKEEADQNSEVMQIEGNVLFYNT